MFGKFLGKTLTFPLKLVTVPVRVVVKAPEVLTGEQSVTDAIEEACEEAFED